MKQLIWIAAALALAGCSKGSSGDSSGQSEAEAWRAACDVTRQRIDELNQVAPVDRQRLMSEMIGSVLKNEKARATFGELANQAPEQRGNSLAAAVAAAGVDDCHLARVLDHDQLVEACNGRGDAEACAAAAAIYEADELFPGRRADATEFREAACMHGDGAQCAAVAETAKDAALWRGRACRRDHQASCGKAGPGGELTVEVEPAGAAATRIETVYAASLADCMVAAGLLGADLTFALEVPREQTGLVLRPDSQLPAGLTDCLDRAVAYWRLPELPAEPLRLTLGWRGSAETAEKGRISQEEIDERTTMAVAVMFGDDSENTGGDLASMAEANPGADLDKSIAEATGRDSTTRGPRGSGEPPTTTLKVHEVAAPDVLPDYSGEVFRKIRRQYIIGLKQCHKNALKVDPSASGTVRLTLRIAESGRVTSVSARGFDSKVDDCIEARAKMWRFARPKDEDGEPTDATITLSLVFAKKD